MDRNRELAFAPAWRLRQMVVERDVSPVELTDLFLSRIEALDPGLNAYLTVCADEARSQAQAAEKAVARGDTLGPLHGVPLSVKDLLMTRGVRCTFGSLVYRDHIPQEESLLVERVRRAGAIVLGKTNTPEFGLSVTTENLLGDACRNPWDTERTAGGSSGGASAAVAAGLGPLAIGSDGGGSIRIPCSFCGVFGIKPTQGRVPRHGGLGRAGDFFSQSGPIARTVRDAASLLQVLSGPDRRDPSCLREEPPDFLADLDRGVRGLRMAWSPDLGYAAVEPEVVTVAERAAQVFGEMGATVEGVSLELEDPFPPFMTIFAAGAYAAYGGLLETHGEQLAPYTRHILEEGQKVSGADYSRAPGEVHILQCRMAELMDTYDLLLTPTLSVPAFVVGERPLVIAGRTVHPWSGFFPFTFPLNMTGQPAASVPCGFSREGMPIGLQILGRLGAEAMVLRASAAFETVRPWADSYPPFSSGAAAPTPERPCVRLLPPV